MLSVMKQYQARLRDRQIASDSMHQPAPDGRGDSIMKGLEDDLARMAAFKSREKRRAIKRETLIPRYKSFVEETVKSGKKHPLLGQYLVWLFDVGEIDQAVNLGRYCEKQSISLPERFRRTVPVYMLDEMLVWSQSQWDAGTVPDPWFQIYLKEVESGERDIPDEITAGYQRLAGIIFQSQGKHKDAVRHLESAMRHGAKVKTALNRSMAELQKS